MLAAFPKEKCFCFISELFLTVLIPFVSKRRKEQGMSRRNDPEAEARVNKTMLFRFETRHTSAHTLETHHTNDYAQKLFMSRLLSARSGGLAIFGKWFEFWTLLCTRCMEG